MLRLIEKEKLSTKVFYVVIQFPFTALNENVVINSARSSSFDTDVMISRYKDKNNNSC